MWGGCFVCFLGCCFLFISAEHQRHSLVGHLQVKNIWGKKKIIIKKKDANCSYLKEFSFSAVLKNTIKSSNNYLSALRELSQCSHTDFTVSLQAVWDFFFFFLQPSVQSAACLRGAGWGHTLYPRSLETPQVGPVEKHCRHENSVAAIGHWCLETCPKKNDLILWTANITLVKHSILFWK